MLIAEGDNESFWSTDITFLFHLVFLGTYMDEKEFELVPYFNVATKMNSFEKSLTYLCLMWVPMIELMTVSNIKPCL